MDLTTFFQSCATSISIGSAYALIAIGYTMVYGILRLINFAHGDIFMMAGYFTIFAMSNFMLPWYLAIPLVLVMTALLGVVIERVAYKPLRSAPRMSIMISAIGVSFFLENFATYLFTGLPKSFPGISFLQIPLEWGSVKLQSVSIITPVVTILLVVALMALVNRTKIGMAMRAASKDFETAQLMGIKINRVISFTFAVGSVLAAVGAILYFCPPAHGLPLQRHDARPEVLCGGGAGRHRLHPRGLHRRLYHRRGGDLPGGHVPRPQRLQRCLYLCASHSHAPGAAHRPAG